MGGSPSMDVAMDLYSKMDNVPHHMLQKKHITSEISLKVAFFNYGVCTSPFEYYSWD